MFNAEFLGTPITTSRSIHNPPPVRRECCPAAKLQILEQALTAELGRCPGATNQPLTASKSMVFSFTDLSGGSSLGQTKMGHVHNGETWMPLWFKFNPSSCSPAPVNVHRVAPKTIVRLATKGRKQESELERDILITANYLEVVMEKNGKENGTVDMVGFGTGGNSGSCRSSSSGSKSGGGGG
nr:hypothetical protein B11B22.140 [imported] - Neurospora crassa [Neurospora crassa]